MSENDSAMDVTKQDVSSPTGGENNLRKKRNILIGFLIAIGIVVTLLLIL